MYTQGRETKVSQDYYLALIIKTSYANLYKEPSFKSELITQGLLWEKITVLDNNNNWFKVKQNDGYISWVHKFYLSEETSQSENSYYRVPIKYQDVYNNLDKPMDSISQVYFGTNIPIKSEYNGKIEIYLPENKIGYLEKIIDNRDDDLRESIIKKTKIFLGVPYLWGGNSSLGFDCSGFVQAILKYFGINFERDTSIQLENRLLKEIDIKNINKADLVYFYINDIVNHVGFIIDENTIIHSSGNVIIESIQDVISRLNIDDKVRITTKIVSINKLLRNKV